MLDKSHRSYDVTAIALVLETLHEKVSRTNGRVEITRRGSEERCVLISKEELFCLERALAILSDTDGVREICNHLAAVAARSGSAAS